MSRSFQTTPRPSDNQLRMRARVVVERTCYIAFKTKQRSMCRLRTDLRSVAAVLPSPTTSPTTSPLCFQMQHLQKMMKSCLLQRGTHVLATTESFKAIVKTKMQAARICRFLCLRATLEYQTAGIHPLTKCAASRQLGRMPTNACSLSRPSYLLLHASSLIPFLQMQNSDSVTAAAAD
jgi:hypothetical protein